MTPKPEPDSIEPATGPSAGSPRRGHLCVHSARAAAGARLPVLCRHLLPGRAAARDDHQRWACAGAAEVSPGTGILTRQAPVCLRTMRWPTLHSGACLHEPTPAEALVGCLKGCTGAYFGLPRLLWHAALPPEEHHCVSSSDQCCTVSEPSRTLNAGFAGRWRFPGIAPLPSATSCSPVWLKSQR